MQKKYMCYLTHCRYVFETAGYTFYLGRNGCYICNYSTQLSNYIKS